MTTEPLVPKYQITRRDYRGNHLYSIKDDPKYQDLHSVTWATGVIEKGGLAPWMVTEALEHVRRDLYEKMGEGTSVHLDIMDIDQLLVNAKEKPDKIKTDAGDYGTIMHHAIDVFIATGKFPSDMSIDVKPALGSFLKWWGNGRNIVKGDTFVVSKRLRIGGALDMVEQREDGLWIGDWKSASYCKSDYPVQVGGGYTIGFEETFGIKPAGATIIRFGKTVPEFEAIDVKSVPDCQEAFIHALELKRAMSNCLYATRPLTKKKIMEKTK